MTERKASLPNVTPDIVDSANREIDEDSLYAEKKLKKFEDNQDHILDVILKRSRSGNYTGVGFALTVYRMLEIASEEEHMGELPVITKDITNRVKGEYVGRQKGFFYDMLGRLREDNGWIAASIDEMLDETGDLESVIPAVEMYRMLEIALERRWTNQIDKQRYKQ